MLHPLIMVIYWFEFNLSDVSVDLIGDVFINRVKHSFSPDMLPMSLIFAFVGGLFGIVFLLYSRVLKLRKKLHDQNKQFIELDNIKSNFLHLISHEIRTPLNGIIGFVEILKKKSVTGEQGHIIDMLEASVIRLENVSCTALKITELRSGVVCLKKAEINVLEELRSRIYKYNKKIIQRQILIRFSPGLYKGQTFVYADACLFGTCVDHIIESALQFCEKNITIDGWEDSTALCTILEISYDWKGFHRLLEKNSFNLFGGSAIQSDNFTGLSFSLIKLICEAHEGKIEIHSSTDGGASVKLYFPFLEN